ncbi:DUF4148 domain-containing protein [Paraburkholderia sp.]|uniref:DUF4148 domain-containing protein n=1 Tax=Paraburkholderia sp. TaxID=1926495 RepID=UPI00286F651D|nr:DUF4148 domain-containing protein [Paraburkholderia sp.]
MKPYRTLIVSLSALACVGVSASASAQALTREQVREQLIEAQANGSRFVTDASYPDVSPVFAQQVAHSPTASPAAQPSGMGAPMQGTSDTGAPRTVCVGPMSFCNLYTGG